MTISAQNPPDRDHLPANIDAEKLVLGLAMVDSKRYLDAVLTLRRDDFVLQKHRTIFTRIREIHARGEHVDGVVVAEELRRHSELESVDGMSYIVSLDDNLPHVPSVDSYIAILREARIRRRMIAGGNLIANQAQDETRSIEELVTDGVKIFAEFAEEHHEAGSHLLDRVPSPWSYEDAMSYLVDGLIIEGQITLWSGESGDGKSTLALAVAAAVARGEPILGRSTVKLPALILDRENPVGVIKDRLSRLGIPDIHDSLTIWGGWWEDHTPPGPDNPEIIRWARETKGLIIWDSLIGFAGCDENSSSEMRKHMAHYRRLASLGATQIIIHHRSEKGESDYRGSSDIRASVDSAWRLSRDDGSNAGDALGRLSLRPYKTRSGPGKTIRIEFIDNTFVPLDAPPRPALDIVIDLVSCHPASTQKELITLAQKQGLSQHPLINALNDGILRHRIEVKVGKHNTRRHYLPEPRLEESA